MDEEERIKELEEELRKTPYNKATQRHIGLVKAQIAKLREKMEKKAAGRGATKGYSIKKTGDAAVVIVGYPSVGKSTLLNTLTNAESKVAPYKFTTLQVIPGLLDYKHARIQILDVPGVVKGAAAGTGRGKEVLAVMRSADLVLILLDVQHPGHLKILQKEVYDAGIRLNGKPPDISIRKTSRGGIVIGKIRRLTVSEETLKDVAREFGIVNAEIIVREDITIEQFIDVIEKNKVYVPAIIILNKIDLVNEKKSGQLINSLSPDVCISAEKDINLDNLKKLIFEKLNFISIYCKQAGKKADLNEPVIMRMGCTIQDVCSKLHKDFIKKFRFARLWGKSAKFPGQKFGLEHVLQDGDVVEVHVK